MRGSVRPPMSGASWPNHTVLFKDVEFVMLKTLFLILLLLYTQPIRPTLADYFTSLTLQEFDLKVDEEYIENNVIELIPLSEDYEIPEDVEEGLASIDQAEPLFIVTRDTDSPNIGLLLLSDEPFIMVKQVNTVVDIMMRGFAFSHTASADLGELLSLQWDKITGILDLKIIEEETPILEETDDKIEIKIGKLRIKILKPTSPSRTTPSPLR